MTVTLEDGTVTYPETKTDLRQPQLFIIRSRTR